MKDRRTEKNKRHYDIYINGLKYKVIACKINEQDGTLSFKTKIKGQPFPSGGELLLYVPSEGYSKTLRAEFKSMSCDSRIEHWKYTFV